MATISSRILGLEFENPFILASAPPTANADMIMRAFELGWAGAVVKTLIREPVANVRNRFASIRFNNGLMAFQNFELLSETTPDEWFRQIRQVKSNFPAKIMISSIMGDARSPDDWVELALGSQDAGADIVELNFSCPHGYPEKGGGSAIGQSAEYTCRIVNWLREDDRIRIPIMPKLTSAVPNIAYIAQAAEEAGADALSAINTVPSLMGFDLRKLEPLASVSGYSGTGGYSGPGIKPIALRAIHDICKGSSLPVFAGGGIFSGFDAAEFILLGARITQICTAVMLEGYGIINRLLEDLETFMSWHGFDALDDFAGKGKEMFVDHSQLDRKYLAKAFLDPEKCTRCRKCYVSCRDGGYQAVYLAGDDVAIDPGRCNGCSLCMQVCRAHAIEMRE